MWKYREIEPQPARGVLKDGMWDSPDWVLEEKYDGDRRIAQFCGKVVRFSGRRISVKDGKFVEKTENVPHLAYASLMGTAPWSKEVAAAAQKLDGTVLDGEMVCMDLLPLAKKDEGKSKFVTSIMGSLPEEAIRKQIERGWLRYVVFDCLFYKSKDVRNESILERRALANEVVQEWGNPYVEMAAQWWKGKRTAYGSILSTGGEGGVFKHIDHRYGDKTGWVKVKKEATADVVIMGFKPAKEQSKKKGEATATRTKYAGKVGSVKIGQYFTPVDEQGRVTRINMKPGSVNWAGVVAVGFARGFDDALMEAFTTGPGRFIGKVIEIKHNGREPTGAFRHPRFSRFRDDKRATDCVFDLEET